MPSSRSAAARPASTWCSGTVRGTSTCRRASPPVTWSAAEDTTLRGQRIKKGDRLILFYGSANRDEEVFEAPDELRLERDPNPHLAFGIGEHFCIGSHLARKTTSALYRELLPRLEHVELAEDAPALVPPRANPRRHSATPDFYHAYLKSVTDPRRRKRAGQHDGFTADYG